MKSVLPQMLSRRVSDSDVIRNPTTLKDGAMQTHVSHSIRKYIPTFKKKTGNKTAISPYYNSTVAEFKAAISRPRPVVVVETEIEEAEVPRVICEFTNPRAAPAVPLRPRFSDPTLRTTVSDPDVTTSALLRECTMEFLKQWEGVVTVRQGAKDVTFTRALDAVASVEDLQKTLSGLSIKQAEVSHHIEVIGDVSMDLQERKFVEAEVVRFDPFLDAAATLPGALLAQPVFKFVETDNKEVEEFDQLSTPPLSPSSSLASPVVSHTVQRTFKPVENDTEECNCSICKRAEKTVDIAAMSEEEQLQMALARSVIDYVTPFSGRIAIGRSVAY